MLPEGSTIVEMLSDYAVIRELARTCHALNKVAGHHNAPCLVAKPGDKPPAKSVQATHS